jgi:hypothetical protein
MLQWIPRMALLLALVLLASLLADFSPLGFTW